MAATLAVVTTTAPVGAPERADGPEQERQGRADGQRPDEHAHGDAPVPAEPAGEDLDAIG